MSVHQSKNIVYPNGDLSEFLTLGNAANYLGERKSTLRTFTREGKITPQRDQVTRARLYKVEDLNGIIEIEKRYRIEYEEKKMVRIEKLEKEIKNLEKRFHSLSVATELAYIELRKIIDMFDSSIDQTDDEQEKFVRELKEDGHERLSDIFKESSFVKVSDKELRICFDRINSVMRKSLMEEVRVWAAYIEKNFPKIEFWAIEDRRNYPEVEVIFNRAVYPRGY